MTNEELVIRIKSGESSLMFVLWEQVKRYVYKRANNFYYSHYNRCSEMGICLSDLEQESYLLIHKAVEKFNIDKGVKFLTYAEYHLKAGFYTMAKLKNGLEYFHETKFEDIKPTSVDGDNVKCEYLLIDIYSENDFINIFEQEQVKYIYNFVHNTLSNWNLTTKEKDTAIAIYGYGLSFSEYARRSGVTRQAVKMVFDKAIQKLKNNHELEEFARSVLTA